MSCKKNLSKEQIFMEFGKDEMDTCNECPNLIYKNGIMTCKELEEENNEN
jgi:hypothetical protein